MRHQSPGHQRTTGLRTMTQTLLNLSSAKPPANLHQHLYRKHRQLPLTAYPVARFAQHLHRHLYVPLQRPCRARCPAVRPVTGRPLIIRQDLYLVKIEPTTNRPSKIRLGSESVSRAPSATSSKRIPSTTASLNAFRIATGLMSTKRFAAFYWSKSTPWFIRRYGTSPSRLHLNYYCVGPSTHEGFLVQINSALSHSTCWPYYNTLKHLLTLPGADNATCLHVRSHTTGSSVLAAQTYRKSLLTVPGYGKIGVHRRL